ncbi:SusC/RagA family TonB-linked outer membrane protein [Bacteroides sp. 224]|uniref:SusC/RagA family TonB-linked outer membrane protein n=1 Tax=Bacteroides sp. 224 TaxID=2302936 RepID=UPI0013D592D5|nr:SusC/RagA family TonB-linked outer membrane protein [Bacteroides sp. 224]NDV63795.1 SusC/RagA family TonB-linked outer membrane protein [Bacteroides sp. 224]
MRKLSKKIAILLLLAVVGSAGNIYSTPGINAYPSNEHAQQQRKVTGVVNDQFGPIAGATVLIKGSTNGTTTDLNGNYTLTNVQDGAIITFSFMGYTTQEIKYTKQSTLNVTLEEDSKVLGEVVVTALGIKKEKRALSYAMSELKAGDIQTVPTQNLGSSLYGKVAGMRISTTAGGPMGGTKIQLRGINSISGSNRPLIVLDGVPIYDDDSNWAGRERNDTQNGSAMNDINPEDIESLSVLKGANAAALYGSRATNGVIIITTKKGTKSKGLGVDFSTSYTTDRVAYLPEYQNQYGVGTKGFFDQNAAGQNILEKTYFSFGPRMDGTNVLWWDGVERPFNPQPDNFKDLFQNGFTNTNTISITSGAEKTSMRLSYANSNYEGFLKNMKQEKHNFNFSGRTQLTEWLTIDASVTFNRTKNLNSPTRIDRASNFPMPRSEISQLYKDHYKDSDGYFMSKDMSDGVHSNLTGNIINYLLWQQNENSYRANKDRWMGTLSANIKIIDPLSLRLTLGTDRLSTLKEDKEMFKKYSAPTDTQAEGLYRKRNESYTKKFYEAMLLFNKSLNDKFDLSLMAAVSAEDIKENMSQWQSNGLLYNGMFSTVNNKFAPTVGNTRNWGYNKSEFMQAVYASGQLAYNHYLYLDITARNDWSSRLPKESRSFFYPSFGLGFVFTDAFELPAWLTYGKARASYAIVGNYTPDIYFANYAYTNGSYDNTIYTNSFSSTVPPVVIEPEKTHSWEFGVELKALNNRIGLDLAYFTNETRNQILNITVPVSSGAEKMGMNAGTIKNYGIEAQINATPIVTKDFEWDATLNFSYTKSELKEFVDGLDSYVIGNPWSVNFMSKPGAPTYGIYIKKWKRDANGNMVVKDGKCLQEEKESFYADAMPKFTGGFSSTFRYKDFTLSAHIDGQFGGKLVSFTNNFLKSSGAGKESFYGRDEEHGGLAYYIDKDTNQKIELKNHNATAPSNSLDGRVYHDGIIVPGVNEDGTKNTTIVTAQAYYSNRYGRNATEDQMYTNTFIKFREISLSYQVPAKIYSKAKLQGLSISLIGSNLFYIYKSVPNVSPESVLGTKAQNAYVEYTCYPYPRSYGFSIKAKF